MTLSPTDYLLTPFNSRSFPDLFHHIWIAALVLLVIQVILYNVRTRQLHRHEPLVNMQEWLLWTGVITFGMLLVEAIFYWYFLFVLLTIALGVATYIWIRFVRFPPEIEAYNAQLRRARFMTQRRGSVETTIKTRRRRRR